MRIAAVLLVAWLAACKGRAHSPAADSAQPASVSASPAAADTSPAASTAQCPTWGLWQPCNVEERLYRAGLEITKEERPVRHDFLHVPGIVYKTARSEVQVFIYPSAAERARDTDVLDTTAVAPPGKRVIWPLPATLVVSNNLAAIILSLNGRQSERIALALGAGLPASGK